MPLMLTNSYKIYNVRLRRILALPYSLRKINSSEIIYYKMIILNRKDCGCSELKRNDYS